MFEKAKKYFVDIAIESKEPDSMTLTEDVDDMEFKIFAVNNERAKLYKVPIKRLQSLLQNIMNALN